MPPPQTVQFQCGQCFKLMAVSVAYLGKRVRCPHCQAVVQVPVPASSAPAPVAPPPVPPRAGPFVRGPPPAPPAAPPPPVEVRPFQSLTPSQADSIFDPQETDDLF